MRKQPRLRQAIDIGLISDRFFKHVAHCSEQAIYVFVAKTRDLSRWMNASLEKNFVGVNVADACD